MHEDMRTYALFGCMICTSCYYQGASADALVVTDFSEAAVELLVEEMPLGPIGPVPLWHEVLTTISCLLFRSWFKDDSSSPERSRT